MKTVSAELIAIIATGIALAGLVLVSQHRLEDRLLAVEKEQARVGVILEGMQKEQTRIGVILDRFEKEFGRVETEQARFRMLHEGVELTAHTHGSKPDYHTKPDYN